LIQLITFFLLGRAPVGASTPGKEPRRDASGRPGQDAKLRRLCLIGPDYRLGGLRPA